jgi:hypothetical protein
MTMFAIEWSNGVGGTVEFRSSGNNVVCRNLDELGDFLARRGAQLDAGAAAALGMLAFYFALRESGSGLPDHVLDRTARVLDAAYVVSQDPVIQAHITEGIDAVREHLFPIRTGSYEELVERAYHFVRSRLLE